MNIRRNFFIGDEWLYYKIYCSPQIADEILISLNSVFDNFLNEKIIDKWFFIRYNDPNNHLRIRFHFVDLNNINKVIMVLNKHLKQYLESQLIVKVVCDTYVREIERYGRNTMELSEHIFCSDSIAVSKFLALKENRDEMFRWAFSLCSIDSFLDEFGYSLTDKLHLLTLMKDNFFKEFQINKTKRIALDKKYRKYTSLIAQTLSNGNPILNERKILNKLTVLEILNKEKQGVLENSLANLGMSYIHMINNRIFASKQRMNEMVIYYFLFKKYKSDLARISIKR